jgi:hypothetical protein
MVWAIESFNKPRMGVAPMAIIDPETRRPLAADAEPAAQEQPQSRPEPALSPAHQPAAESDLPPDPCDDEPLPLPRNVPDEENETFQVVGATLRGLFRAGLLELPRSGPPPAAPPRGR